MEPSSPLGDAIDPPTHRWAGLLGTTIALLTLTFPFLAIANYSSTTDSQLLPPPSYLSQPRR